MHFQEKTQIYLPMTIMGCFGLIGGTALIILEDRSPAVNTTEDSTANNDTTTNDDDNNQTQDDANDDNKDQTTESNENNSNEETTTTTTNNDNDNATSNDQDQTDGSLLHDTAKSRIPRLKANLKSTSTDV